MLYPVIIEKIDKNMIIQTQKIFLSICQQNKTKQ